MRGHIQYDFATIQHDLYEDDRSHVRRVFYEEGTARYYRYYSVFDRIAPQTGQPAPQLADVIRCSSTIAQTLAEHL